MIQPGDVIAVRGRGWLSDGIAAAEYPEGEPPISATHVGIAIAGDPFPLVIEALERVKTNPLPATISNAQKAFVLRDKSLTDNQRRLIVYTACGFSADDYGYVDLVAQRLNATFGTTWFTDRLSGYLQRWPICSYVVASAYAAAGLNFGVDDASCTPANVVEFALSHPEIYEIDSLK